jgi:hypothetical protein
MKRQAWFPVAAGLAALLAPADGTGQSVVLDEGSFAIFRDGAAAGRETFTIRRQGIGGDATLLANGAVLLETAEGSMEMRPLLQAAADRSPRAYQNKLQGADVSQVDLTAAGPHFVTVIRSTSGERERELRAHPGTLLLDLDVAHHYWFLAPRTDRPGETISVVVPRAGQQMTMEVTAVRPVTLRMGGTDVGARRVTLTLGDETREVWFDEQGRVLRIEIPSAHYVAERESL